MQRILIQNDIDIFKNEYNIDSQLIDFIKSFQQWLLSIKGKNQIQRDFPDDPIYSKFGSMLLMYNGEDFNDIDTRKDVKDEIERVFNLAYGTQQSADVSLNKDGIQFNVGHKSVKIIIPIKFAGQVQSFSVDIYTGEIYLL